MVTIPYTSVAQRVREFLDRWRGHILAEKIAWIGLDGPAYNAISETELANELRKLVLEAESDADKQGYYRAIQNVLEIMTSYTNRPPWRIWWTGDSPCNSS